MNAIPVTIETVPKSPLDPKVQLAIDVIASLPPKSQDAIREVVESAVDVVHERSGGPASLAEILQRVFVRSVAEFFTSQRQSTQLPNELLPYIGPCEGAVPLPPPAETIDASLSDVLDARRSNRNFSNEPVSLEQLSTLLHFAAGRRGIEAGYGVKDMPLFRYPTIGGLNSVDVGIIVNRVDGLERGFYIYDPIGHALTLRDRGDMRLVVQDVTFEAEWLFHAPAIVTVIHNQDKVSWKYKTRALRFSHVDLGALTQNFYLVATATGYNCCAVAGFFDEAINNFLKLDGTRQFVSLLIGVGPAGRITLAQEE
ncbi:SagB/ThcOx family dehydrogenase [Microbacterium lacticum]|uniref:SagB/ThcOx family dehydrogenase n=1 Tax=Microbacterium lacticum TaxID=33885 RepID=UPI003A88E89F